MTSRKMWRLCGAVAACSVVIGAPLPRGCTTKSSGPTLSQRELLGKILKAIDESTARLPSGKGAARVRIYGERPKQEPIQAGTPRPWKPKYIGREKTDESSLVDFWFKGQRSKSAFYGIEDGKRGKLTRVHVDAVDNWFTFLPEYRAGRNESQLWIRSTRDYGFHRVPGQDFHPEAILNQPGPGITGGGIEFRHVLKLLLKREKFDRFAVDDEDNGLISISAEFGKGAVTVSFLVDPEADYRVLRYRLHGAEAGMIFKDMFDRYDATWKRYGTVWYIESLAVEHERIAGKKAGKISLDRKQRIEVTVESFDPQAEIDDSEFTPGSLRIPPGTELTDRRVRVWCIPELERLPPAGERISSQLKEHALQYILELDQLKPEERKIHRYLEEPRYEKTVEDLEAKAEMVEEICEGGVCKLAPTREALYAKRVLAWAHYLHGAVGSGGYNHEVEKARLYAAGVGASDGELAKKDLLIHALSGGAEKEEKAFREKYVSKKAPELSTQHWINSEPLTINDLQGKLILLEFWALDCTPCRHLVPGLEDMHKEYANKGLVIIAVHEGTEDHQPVEDFIREMGISFPVAIDRGEGWGGDTFRAYEVNFVPQAWWIDKKGCVIRTGRDLQSDIRVDDLLKE